jgi:hypothetical protein
MEQLFGLGVIALVLYLVIRLAARGIAGLSGARFRAYRHVANRFGGRYESRGLVDPPTVSFGHRGATVRVGLAPTVAGQSSFPRTRVVARFPRGLPLRLELQPFGRPIPPQPPKGTRLVRSGHVEFDKLYLVQANDPDMARAWLDPPTVRGAIEALRRQSPPAGMLVSINPERILVQVDRNLAVHSVLLEAAVRDTLTLLDALTLIVTAQLERGIEIVAVGPSSPEDAGPPVCEVCGDPIASAHVACASCKTPFHRDCWTFIGGCSTFGCASKHCNAVTMVGN